MNVEYNLYSLWTTSNTAITLFYNFTVAGHGYHHNGYHHNRLKTIPVICNIQQFTYYAINKKHNDIQNISDFDDFEIIGFSTYKHAKEFLDNNPHFKSIICPETVIRQSTYK